MDNNEECSAFSFKLAKQVEEFINTEVGDIKERNQILEAKILHFRQSVLVNLNTDISYPDIIYRYDKFFEITCKREGKI
jgi:hypothetical protein